MPTPMTRPAKTSARQLFDDAEVRDVLERSFYADSVPLAPLAAVAPSGKRRRAAKPKPDHYEILCISMYVDDRRRMDEKVQALKARGHRRMTRSALIRWALDHVDLDAIPRSP